MARATTRRPPTGGPRPLIETNAEAGINRLRNRLGDLEKLDPEAHNDPRFETTAQTIRSNIQEIFGEDSPEFGNHCTLQIEHSDGPFYLGGDDDESYDDDGSYGSTRASSKQVTRRREGIVRTRVKLESLITQLEERVAENAQTARTQQVGAGDMGSPLDTLANDQITLVKPDATEHRTKAVVERASILVSRATFPVEAGDTIVRDMPTGVPAERYEVLDAHYTNAQHGMGHWKISIRKLSPRPIATPPAATHITNHTYNVNQAAVVGPGGTAVDNALVQHNTHQTLNVDLGRLAEDLSAIRKALLAEAAENEDDLDAAEEAVKVGRVQKAIKAGEQSGIVSVLKTLGTKTWALGERLALAYVNFKLRDQLGLPPGKP